MLDLTSTQELTMEVLKLLEGRCLYVFSVKSEVGNSCSCSSSSSSSFSRWPISRP